MHHMLSELRASGNGDIGRHFDFVPPVSPAMDAMLQALADIAGSSAPVLILGERGSGKRTAAFRLHVLSRRKQDFEEVACRTLTAESFPTIGAELMGHRGGTVLMTEIADLSAECQKLLLDQLVERGALSTGRRLIASSAHDLEQEIRDGRFREDLYYRLTGICLRIPPLRQRREDIPTLTEYFLNRYAAMFGRPQPALSESTVRFLNEYSWPGNVSELEAAVKTIMAIGHERIALAALRTASLEKVEAQYQEGTSLKEASRAASRQAERELILRVLSRTRWNRKRAAEELRISYKALLYKLKQIGVDDASKSVISGEQA